MEFFKVFFLDRSYFNNKVRSGIIAFFHVIPRYEKKAIFSLLTSCINETGNYFHGKMKRKYTYKRVRTFLVYILRVYFNFYNSKNLHLRSSDYPILTPSLYKCQIVGHRIGHHSDHHVRCDDRRDARLSLGSGFVRFKNPSLRGL